MYSYQKVYKTGNSLGVTIPAKFAKYLGVKAGTLVRQQVDRAEGKVTYTFIGSSQLQLLNKKP